MMSTMPKINLVFHVGALGDWVLTFPIMRALRGPTVVVTSWSKAKLAEELFDHVRAMDIELREFTRLHAPGGPAALGPAVGEALSQADALISFISNGSDAWAQNVRRLAPQAKHIFLPPRPPDDRDLHVTDWHAEQLASQGLPLETQAIAIQNHAQGLVVIHPGSGGEAKCWPADRFECLIQALEQTGQAVRVLLGEVELETWPAAIQKSWAKSFPVEEIRDLDALRLILTQASFYIGNDSGPTHLAAQMGVPTVALFGPTRANQWAPIGPAVHVLAPSHPQPMTWLGLDRVLAACTELGRMIGRDDLNVV